MTVPPGPSYGPGPAAPPRPRPGWAPPPGTAPDPGADPRFGPVGPIGPVPAPRSDGQGYLDRGYVPAPPPLPTGTGPGAPGAPGLATAPLLGTAEPTTSRRFLQVRGPGVWALAVALLSLVAWMITKSQALGTLTLALAVAVAVDGWLALRGVRAASIVLTPDGDAVADEPTRWLLEVEELSRPVTVQPVRTPKPRPILVEPGRPGLVSVPPTTRGVIHFLVIDAVSTGPIGLCHAGRRYRITPPTPVVVRPRPLPIHVRWPTPKAVGFGLSEVAPRGDDLFRGVREYQRGDERRKIHWKATARLGELMVREDDGTGVVALQIVVDLDAHPFENERTVAAAAWMTEAAIERGWIVQLVTLDDTPPVPLMPDLGSPFKRPPITRPAPGRPPQSLAQHVHTVDAARRQLATASPGRPAAPRWTGLSCHIGRDGVQWP